MITGILNIKKEKGYTSHDVVAKLRGILKQKKIGHTGTLDPDATGVLPVCLGNATKLCDLLTDKTKEYEAEFLLGLVTDTQDTTGETISEHEVTCIEERVREVIAGFQGELEQIPPMYSAIKINGKKLYELARAGIEVERKARKIEIFEIEILEVKLPKVHIRVACSKGTYIRTLCYDIGQMLGCGATMSDLIRTKSGNYKLEDAKTLSEIEAYVLENRIEELINPLESVFQDKKKVKISPRGEKFLKNGNPLFADMLEESMDSADTEEILVYNLEGTLNGLYRFEQKKNCYMPQKMFLI